ncbi:hypothetical protein PM082_005254 [Marasmius tenuissimus]|nr:hypothetical protein PM082_005254 [Marasmius tenuissimus]
MERYLPGLPGNIEGALKRVWPIKVPAFADFVAHDVLKGMRSTAVSLTVDDKTQFLKGTVVDRTTSTSNVLAGVRARMLIIADFPALIGGT